MHPFARPSTRKLWLAWLIVCLCWAGVLVYPVSNVLTRTAGAALFLALWAGLLGLCWKQRAARYGLLGISLTAAALAGLPARAKPETAGLRTAYLEGLLRYEGVRYSWGGESPTGIDCSGLIRRGLVDGLLKEGVQSADPGLIRGAITLWWHDASARTLGTPANGMTVHLMDTPGLNQLDHSTLLPGDLAVTLNGVHIMAYLGNLRWIEADPKPGRVITVTVPEQANPYFKTPVKIMRWMILQPPGG